MPAYYIYILECIGKNGKITYYTGYTSDLYKRFKQHKEGRGAKYTRGKKLKLIHYESFLNRSDAMKREIEIKSMNSEQKKALINHKHNNESNK